MQPMTQTRADGTSGEATPEEMAHPMAAAALLSIWSLRPLAPGLIGLLGWWLGIS